MKRRITKSLYYSYSSKLGMRGKSWKTYSRKIYFNNLEILKTHKEKLNSLLCIIQEALRK